MCVVSMIHDHYDDLIPQIDPWNPNHPVPNVKPVTITTPSSFFDFNELAKLIQEFRQLVDMAKTIDAKTNQPDCVDPEKAKLQDRIEELEKLIAQPPEFVIVTGGKVEPGRYRVIDGKLYKAVENE